MKSEIIRFKNRKKEKNMKQLLILTLINFKKYFYIFIILFIIFISLFSSFIIIIHKNNNNYIKNINIKELIQSETNFDNKICQFINTKLKNRKKPFDFEEELCFIISLIACKIPFSFIRFADGENYIMRGKKINVGIDNWNWDDKNQKFRESLIESSSICLNPNNFIAIPCKNWFTISKSILSFSKCSNSKYMSYASVFYNKNFEFFQKWIVKFINSSNRWKIVLVANSLVNKDISWAYKFFPIPEHIVEKWDELSDTLLPKLEDEAKKSKMIFFVSAGPAANIIISHLIKINNKNIYIDFGSSIEMITKGFSTRYYLKNGVESFKSCESFYLENHIPIYLE